MPDKNDCLALNLSWCAGKREERGRVLIRLCPSFVIAKDEVNQTYGEEADLPDGLVRPCEKEQQ